MDAANYAAFQNANFNPETNQILYGQSASANVFGVSNGTCQNNQLNPLIFTPQYKCGFGVAGGNPSYMDTELTYNSKEGFENVQKLNNGMNVTLIVNIVIILLILYLVYIEFLEKSQTV
jgi:hypothetical protein